MIKQLLVIAPIVCACGIPTGDAGSLGQTDTQSVPARRGTVISDGCTLDSWQLEILGATPTKTVVHDVVLECLLPHADGTVTPADSAGTTQLQELILQLHALGYTVTLAANFVTDNGNVFDGPQTAAELANWQWSSEVATGIVQVAKSVDADAIDLDLEQLPAAARQDLTHLVSLVAAGARPLKKVGIFLPPSTQTPSDVPGGDAFDIVSLVPYVDRFHVMTLDYSGITPASKPGPTIDSGWAVDAVRFALVYTGNAAVDVAFPLYGNDFTTSITTAAVRSTTYLEAVGAANTFKATPQRSPSQELILDYTDDTHLSHELWFDDAKSTLVTLAAWDTKTLDPAIGVVFYGLGAEDPALWAAIAGATK